LLPSELTATPVGSAPTGIVAVTAFVAVAMTDTVLEDWFVTSTLLPSGLTAAPTGVTPTPIVAVTVLVVVSMTDTVLSSTFVI
jgi:hypothetical protein